MLASALLATIGVGINAQLVASMPRVPLPRPAATALRAIAKDGHDLPAAQATERPAHVVMGPGETADFEFRPATSGEWLLEVKSVETGWYIPLTMIVTAPARERPRQ